MYNNRKYNKFLKCKNSVLLYFSIVKWSVLVIAFSRPKIYTYLLTLLCRLSEEHFSFKDDVLLHVAGRRGGTGGMGGVGEYSGGFRSATPNENFGSFGGRSANPNENFGPSGGQQPQY